MPMGFHMNCNTMGLEVRETILQQLSQSVSGFSQIPNFWNQYHNRYSYFEFFTWIVSKFENIKCQECMFSDKA